MLSIGTLIWISVKPLMKMALTVIFGIILTRKDLFGGVAARGAGQVVVNIAVPALLFSKIVPSFTSQNISALGPLVLIGLSYKLAGFLFALCVRQFFWVPHRFRYGILVAGTWGNWGDIPTAVIMGITSAAPFNGSQDTGLAVAYISVFILVFFITLFPLGGHLLIAKDFEGPDYTDDEVRESFVTRVKKTGESIAQLPSTVGKLFKRRKASTSDQDAETTVEAQTPEKGDDDEKTPEGSVVDERKTLSTELTAVPSRMTPYAATLISAPTAVPEDDILPTSNIPKLESEISKETPSVPKKKTFLSYILVILRTLNSPPTIAIFVSFPVALVPQLKALFVPLPTSPLGPDGLPPLAFILDTATFIGNASVPMGLICLGSALARLNIPRPWTRLPLGAISIFTIGKLFFMPVVGILITSFFTYVVPLINKDDKVLRFVCIFFSSVPTATTQVLLTQVHSPDGNAEHLSAFLVPQYALMFLSMTTLNAFALHMLFG